MDVIEEAVVAAMSAEEVVVRDFALPLLGYTRLSDVFVILYRFRDSQTISSRNPILSNVDLLLLPCSPLQFA